VVATVNMGRQAYEPSSNGQASAAAFDSEKGEIFVAISDTNTVSIISDSTNEVVANVTVGDYPNNLAYDSGQGEIFVANSGDNTVSVISDSTNSVLATVPVGTYPFGIAYDSGQGEIFVTNNGSPSISVLSDSSSTSSSPSPTPSPSTSPTVPEFSTAGLILVVATIAAVTLCAVALAVRKSTRTYSDSEQKTKL
jgi:YVTN family beta-propeller protein